MNRTTYQLPARRVGTAVGGLTVGQVTLLGTGIAVMTAGTAAVGSAAGTVGGVTAGVTCLLLAVLRVGGRPLREVLPAVAAFAWRRARRGDRWVQPLPLAAAADTGRRRPARRGPLPACLAGVEVIAVDRPDWAGGQRSLAPVGLVRHRRTGAVTVILDVRGGPFSLLEPAGQERQLGAWARVLSQFARETPVARLGWTLWSGPGSASDPLARLDDWTAGDTQASGGDRQTGRAAGGARLAAESYRQLLAEAAPAMLHHDLRLWLTVAARGLRRSGVTPQEAAVAAARPLAERCAAAGLVVGGLLSPVEVAQTVRVHADPAARTGLDGVRRGLATKTGLGAAVDPALLAPLTIRTHWDAVQIDGGWHRLFWIAHWPTLALRAGWLDPLLHETPGVRTVTVIMEPVPPRLSRRRLNTESVSVDTQLQLRHRHAFRVPVHLTQAHEEIDRRDAELQAGYPEYGYLGLVDVTAASRTDLDETSQAMVDLAARCGITELRPLHGRHDLAWAATLPIGLPPARSLLGGG